MSNPTKSMAEKKAQWIGTARWIYWVFTLLFCAAILSGGIAMLMGVPQNIEGLMHLGYPAYLAKILGTAKVLGVTAILYGRARTLKEWAYAGFTFNLMGATASHAFSGDPAWKIATPLVLLAIMLMTRRQWRTGWM